MEEFDLLEHTLAPATTLIEASAGTGKTYNIQHLYLRLIIEKEATPEKILVVTFSEAATAELKLRICNNLVAAEDYLLTSYLKKADNELDESLVRIVDRAIGRDSYDVILRRVQYALYALDEAAILTIHSFCMRVLTENAFESGALFGVEIVDNKDKLFADIIGDFLRREIVYNEEVEAGVLRGEISLSWLKNIAYRIYGKDDVHVLGEDFDVSVADIYHRFLLEDIAGIDSLVKRKNKALTAFFEFVLDRAPVSDEVVAQMLRLIDGASGIIKTKYFNNDFPESFRELFLAALALKDRLATQLYKKFVTYLQNIYEDSTGGEDEKKLVFDDLLYMTRKAIHRKNSRLAKVVRGKYEAVLVDEFQDTSGVQYDIFNSLFGNSVVPFFMIGDPKQSIYAFRGADIFAYMKSVRSENILRRTLVRNFRSTPEFIDNLNILFANRKSMEEGIDLPFIYEEVEYFDVKAGRSDSRRLKFPEGRTALELWWEDGGEKSLTTGVAEKKALAAVADDIATKLSQANGGDVYCLENNVRSSVLASDFAVLVNENKQAENMRQELRRRNVPAVVLKSGSVFNSSESKELRIILQAVVDYNKESAVFAALSTRCFGYSLEELSAINSTEHQVREYWFEFFAVLNDIWATSGFLAMFSRLFKCEHSEILRSSCNVYVAGLLNGERALTNYFHLVEILGQKSLESAATAEKLLAIFDEQLLTDNNSDEYEMRLESDGLAVKIMTVHKSKGLQFPVVYVPFLFKKDRCKKIDFKNGPVVCNLQDDGGIGIVFDKAGLKGIEDRVLKESRAEEMRILYVAVTRAVDKCILLGGNINNIERSALCDVLGNEFERIDEFRKNGKISVVDNWGEEFFAYEPPIVSEALHFDEFSGSVEREWGVMSYSSLVSHDFERVDVRSDLVESKLLEVIGGVEDEAGMGAVLTGEIRDNLAPLVSNNIVGSAVHEILEEVDFSELVSGWKEEEILARLKKFGVLRSSATVDSAKQEIIGVARTLKIIGEVVLRPSVGERFTLGDIVSGSRLSEMSFYFPVRRKISTERVADFLQRRGLSQYRKYDELQAVLTDLGITLQKKGFREGFMFGLIDLVFEHNGRFYFADWKTNNLNRYGGYTTSAVLTSMSESGYLLQFYIYTVALVLFLRSRIGGFSYSEHFGGGYYLYLRGLDVENPVSGVFYECPSEEDVLELIDIFTGGADGK